MNDFHHRIIVTGSTGSGKTTLAMQLARQLNIPGIDLDDLYWGPNWTPVPLEEFRAKTDQATRQPSWAISGNYRVVRDLVWPRAETLVWLDYAFPLVFYRLMKRTISRIITGELACNGNRESLSAAFGKDSIIVWLFKSYWRRKRDVPVLLQQPEHAHLRVHHFRSPHETANWLAALSAPAVAPAPESASVKTDAYV
jgi:adenylate kinase family enzyme